jgi:ABC-type transport system involved in multi-copper enzyme maturation permease subunit
MQQEHRASPASPAPRDSLRAIATIARYTAAEAIHSRVLVTALLIIVAGVALGQFTGELALTDSRGIGAASQAWLFRLSAVFLVAGFAISSLVREANDKGLELLLALPLPRAGYLFGKWGGCTLAAAFLATLFALPLLFTAPWIGVSAWAVSLFFELAIVASASLLCALTFTHVVASLAAVSAFYTLSRTMAALLAIGGNAVAPQDSAAFRFATSMLDAIAALLPRLDRFGRTDWLMVDAAPWTDMPWLLVQTVVYVALLLSAAYIDLMRKSV